MTYYHLLHAHPRTVQREDTTDQLGRPLEMGFHYVLASPNDEGDPATIVAGPFTKRDARTILHIFTALDNAGAELHYPKDEKELPSDARRGVS